MIKGALTTILISSFALNCAMADLVVVSKGNDANSVAAAPYLNILKPTKAFELQQQKRKDAKPMSIEQAYFPVKSNLTAGKVLKHQINNHLDTMPAIFIVSNGPDSLRWLNANAEYLKKIGAIGMVTNIDSQSDINRMTKHYGIAMIPGNLEGIKKTLGLSHYPALIYKGWVTQ
tara:strand:- start:4753 stop:5274 length:522 start_codon:yes stop_codon:yes gene_type:complete